MITLLVTEVAEHEFCACCTDTLQVKGRELLSTKLHVASPPPCLETQTGQSLGFSSLSRDFTLSDNMFNYTKHIRVTCRENRDNVQH